MQQRPRDSRDQIRPTSENRQTTAPVGRRTELQRTSKRHYGTARFESRIEGMTANTLWLLNGSDVPQGVFRAVSFFFLHFSISHGLVSGPAVKKGGIMCRSRDHVLCSEDPRSMAYRYSSRTLEDSLNFHCAALVTRTPAVWCVFRVTVWDLRGPRRHHEEGVIPVSIEVVER